MGYPTSDGASPRVLRAHPRRRWTVLAVIAALAAITNNLSSIAGFVERLVPDRASTHVSLVRDSSLAHALEAWEHGDHPQAMAWAQHAVNLNPGDGAAWKLLGAGDLIDRHDAEAAAVNYRHAIHARESDGEAWLGYADSLSKQPGAHPSTVRYAYRQAARLAGKNAAVAQAAERGLRELGGRR